jgi:hypothetical protein
MIIQANMPFINAQNKYKISTGKRAESAEKLSSGYRINRAKDDAAGLSISEKLRSQIRGLNKGSNNGEDGVSWVQVGDGALNEVHSILHRMKELTVQALNDTNTEDDRAALQAEMDSLQSEIDRITDTTLFNNRIYSGLNPYLNLDLFKMEMLGIESELGHGVDYYYWIANPRVRIVMESNEENFRIRFDYNTSQGYDIGEFFEIEPNHTDMNYGYQEDNYSAWFLSDTMRSKTSGKN